MKRLVTTLCLTEKRLNKKGMALVQVEAYLNRRKIYFSAKIYLKPEQWDTKT